MNAPQLHLGRTAKMKTDVMSRFTPYFQPIIDITRGRICGYEALAREYDEIGRAMSCGRYFADPKVDRAFLLELDRDVRLKALQQLPNMPEDTFLTLNISPEWIEQLNPSESVPTIEMVEALGVDPGRIIIEITETRGELEALQTLVNRYRKAGMRIAIDDFGAGYSELGRLIALEPDLIKLDMRFFKSAVAGGIAHEAVQAIGFMAERIGCDILCEGVEDAREFQFAVDSGATLIQGFLFYPAREGFVDPLAPKEQITSLLKEFVAEKTALEKRHISRHQTIVSYANALVATAVVTDDSTASLPPPPQGFIRFYICNQHGEQLSPNYDYYQSAWHIDSQCVGMNWSGRPFLYQVLALNTLMERQVVTTRPYRDRTSRELFQTLGLKLDAERILLIDYEPS